MPLDILDTLLVALHVPAGVIAVIGGAGAMWSEKGSAAHRSRGRVYLGALAVTCVTGAGLVATRWPRFPHLLALGGLAALLASIGYGSRRRSTPRVHLAAMGGSFVALLTAFYVDNGPKLPLWNLLPPLSFWFLPSLLGLPIILCALRRHPPGRAR